MTALVLALSLSGCVTRPSATPLGVGPLPPGSKLSAELRKEGKKKRADRKPSRDEQDSATEVTVEVDEPSTPTKVATADTAAAVAKTDSHPAAAGTASASAVLPDPSGDYRGDDVSAYKLSGIPDRTEKDPNARVNVRGTGDKKLDFVLVDSSNGKDICTLAGTLDGRTATISKGQSCFEQDEGAASASATVTRGTATFENARLVLDLTLDFALQVGDDEHAGTLEYHFDGTRR